VDTLKKYRGHFTGPHSPLRAAGAEGLGGGADHPYRMLQASVATGVGKLIESLAQYDADTSEFLCQMGLMDPGGYDAASPVTSVAGMVRVLRKIQCHNRLTGHMDEMEIEAWVDPDGDVDESCLSEDEGPPEVDEEEAQVAEEADRKLTARPPTPRYTRTIQYLTRAGDTRATLAKLYLGGEDHWAGVQRIDGKRIEETAHEPLPIGLLLRFPAEDQDDWKLSREEKEQLKRRSSLPNPKDMRPLSAHFKAMTLAQQAAEAKRKAETEAEEKRQKEEAKRQKKLEAEQAKRFRARVTRLNRDFLLEYQNIADQHERVHIGIWEEFTTQARAIQAVYNARTELSSHAFDLQQMYAEEERMLRAALEQMFFRGVETHDRQVVAAAQEQLLQQLEKIKGVQMVSFKYRMQTQGQEAKMRDKYWEEFSTRRDLLNLHKQQIIDHLEAEEVARAKQEDQYNRWVEKFSLRRRLLDLQAVCLWQRGPFEQDRLEEMTAIHTSYRVQQREVFCTVEDRLRQVLAEEEDYWAVWLGFESRLLRVMADEDSEREQYQFHNHIDRLQVFGDFCAANMELFHEEQAQRRQKLARQHEKWIVDRFWYFSMLGTQHDEEAPRRHMAMEMRQALVRLHKRCAAEALQLWQVYEEQLRQKRVQEWRNHVLKMQHETERLDVVGRERHQRVGLMKTLLREYKALVRRGRLEQAAIGLIDLVRGETPIREAMLHDEDQSWWVLRHTVVIGGETVARRLIDRQERREWTRVGRGLQDYQHMLELDQISNLFNIWKPNDLLLVPFVVPRGKSKGSTLQDVRSRSAQGAFRSQSSPLLSPGRPSTEDLGSTRGVPRSSTERAPLRRKQDRFSPRGHGAPLPSPSSTRSSSHLTSTGALYSPGGSPPRAPYGRRRSVEDIPPLTDHWTRPGVSLLTTSSMDAALLCHPSEDPRLQGDYRQLPRVSRTSEGIRPRTNPSLPPVTVTGHPQRSTHNVWDLRPRSAGRLGAG